jgi:hypothetical protein
LGNILDYHRPKRWSENISWSCKSYFLLSISVINSTQKAIILSSVIVISKKKNDLFTRKINIEISCHLKATFIEYLNVLQRPVSLLSKPTDYRWLPKKLNIIEMILHYSSREYLDRSFQAYIIDICQILTSKFFFLTE